MKDYEIMVGKFENNEILNHVIFGMVEYLFHVYIHILCITHPISVCVAMIR